VEKELAEIRKEVVESRNLVIKTDNLLKNLHAELKGVAKRQDEISRRAWVGSMVAYILFTALAFTGATMTGNARVSSARDEVGGLTKQVELLKTQVAQLQKEKEDRRLATEGAAKAYAAIAEGTPEGRLKGVDALAALDRKLLSPLESRALDDRAHLLKGELSSRALEEGRDAFRRNDFKVAAVQLQRFLTLSPDSPDSASAAFMLGNAYFGIRDYQNAIAPLEKFIAHPQGQKNVDYACFLLGQSQDLVGEHSKAADTLWRAIEDYPASQHVPTMRIALSHARSAVSNATPPPPKTP
jgi:TolA-binding protein